MKKVITSFIKIVVILLIFAIIIFFLYILYNEFIDVNFENQIKDFTSNITIYGEYNTDKEESNEVIELILDNDEVSTNTLEQDDYDINKYFFYNQLEDEAKIIYDALEKNKENMKTGTYQIELGTIFTNLLEQENGGELLGNYYQSAIEAYTYDNPDVFYLQLSKMYLNIETTTKGSNTTHNVFINCGNNDNYLIDSFDNQEKVEQALNEIQNIANEILKNKKEDDYSNIKMIHDYLVENVEYDSSLTEENIYNVYGALVNKKSVCEGYAKAFKYLAKELDIPCTIVIGTATNSNGETENHAWNYVRLNGNWYAIDCTWDDPIIIGGGTLSTSSKYRYFLKGEEEFSKTHIPNGQFTEGGKIFEYPNLNTNNY